MKILLILSEPRTIFLNFPRCRRSAELMDGGSGSSGTGEECSVGLFRSGRAERDIPGPGDRTVGSRWLT